MEFPFLCGLRVSVYAKAHQHPSTSLDLKQDRPKFSAAGARRMMGITSDAIRSADRGGF
jgi:hypothetical protein